MKLFYVPGVCSLSPHIVLREMGADFQLDKVDRGTKVSESAPQSRFLLKQPAGTHMCHKPVPL